LFGTNVAQISAAEGLQLAVAAQSMTSGGPGILDRLRSTFGLDRLSLGNSASNTPNMTLPQSSINPIISPTPGTTSTSTSQTTTAAVSGGKYVAPGVFVGVDQGATAQSTRMKVEIEVSRHVTVYSSVGADNSNQLGANWRYDY
jgi:autotransporter translocation and assembly factor TamB